MTTITIKKSKGFSKTDFESPKELFEYLRDKLTPVPVYLVDNNEIPENLRKSIEEAESEGEKDIVDFRG